ncbi:MAG: acyl-CoA synthetase FdrA [Myxococcales bacterium]|nr:acyl-CoA synthetase FdrA [Myxococcales bacterium]
MKEKLVVRKGAYHDSAFLMRVTRQLKGISNIFDAVVVMGTPMNLELLAASNFMGEALESVTPMDMVVALRGASADAIAVAEQELEKLLQGGEQQTGDESAGLPIDLTTALTQNPDAQLVSVSVPGTYAAYVASRALDADRHVFLFSDNVSVEDELALKTRALEKGLFVMGPDCGTAIIAGVGLGFANRVRQGRIGVVGASGTGMQELTSLICEQEGEGISQAIGTGGRDLSKAIGARMTDLGLRVLAADPGTDVICVVAKHPADEVADRVHTILEGLGKPVVVRYMGNAVRPSTSNVFYASTIDEAAQAAARLARGEPLTFSKQCSGCGDACFKADKIKEGRVIPKRLIGLYSGGSLAYEAALFLQQKGIAVHEPKVAMKSSGPIEFDGNLVIDTGEDFYTVGKPHPMVDQTVRCELIEKVGADKSVGVLLLDVVLGDGSHADPAPELVAAVNAAKAARGSDDLLVLASITGTELDPQDLSRQKAILKAAGILVAPTASKAARIASELLA